MNKYNVCLVQTFCKLILRCLSSPKFLCFLGWILVRKSEHTYLLKTVGVSQIDYIIMIITERQRLDRVHKCIVTEVIS